MKKSILFSVLFVGVLSLLISSCKKDEVITDPKADYVLNFEDLSLNPDSYWAGPDTRVDPETVNLYGTDCQVYYGNFTEQKVKFSNTFNGTWKSWSGFAYSNMTNMDSAGYKNQFSVYSPAGANSSSNFGLAFAPEVATPITNIEFDTLVSPQSFMLNISTYTYLDIKNGSAFSSPFKDGDYYKVQIEGFDINNNSTGKLDSYLADFRSGKTYIVTNWTKVDLTALGKVKKIEFKIISSNQNTPTYFCLDNLEALK